MAKQSPMYEDPQTLTQFRELQRRIASLGHGIAATPSSLATAHHLLAAVETMQLGVTIADASGVILYSNPAQARMYGVDAPKEMIGEDVGVFCLPGYRDHLTLERLGGMKSWRRESVNVRKDGSVFPVHLLSDVIRGADGEPIGVITTCEDLTEVKLAEAERNRLQLQARHSYTLENLGALASDLASEFGDMLAIVVGHTGPFLGDLPLDGEWVGRYIAEVDAAVHRMAVLTERLMAYSGRGGMPPLDLTGHLRGMLRPLEASVERNVGFRYELLAELPSINADPTDIDHVLRQLITNASEAFKGCPGEIGVRTEARYLDQAELDQCQIRGNTMPGSYVLLEVSDDGPGMTTEVAAQIFEPFFSTRSPSGGLGLAATAAIVRRHEGAIWLSTHPGKGTRFRLFFPVAPRTATSGPSTPKLAILETVDPNE
jgi:PAS domain S-box-containing protein